MELIIIIIIIIDINDAVRFKCMYLLCRRFI